MSMRVTLASALASAGLVAAGFAAGTLSPLPAPAPSFQAEPGALPGTIAELAAAPTRMLTREQLLGHNAASVQLVSSPGYTGAGYANSLQAKLDRHHA